MSVDKVQRLWRKNEANEYKRVYSETVSDAVQVDMNGTTLTDKLDSIDANIAALDQRETDHYNELSQSLNNALTLINQRLAELAGNINTLNNAVDALQRNFNELSIKVDFYLASLQDVDVKTYVAAVTSSMSSELIAYIDNTKRIIESEADAGTIGKAIHIGSSSPSNTKLLWYDTNTNGGLKCYNNDSWTNVPVCFK